MRYPNEQIDAEDMDGAAKYRRLEVGRMNDKEIIAEIDRHIIMAARPEFKAFTSNSEECVKGIITGLRIAKDIVEKQGDDSEK